MIPGELDLVDSTVSAPSIGERPRLQYNDALCGTLVCLSVSLGLEATSLAQSGKRGCCACFTLSRSTVPRVRWGLAISGGEKERATVGLVYTTFLPTFG